MLLRDVMTRHIEEVPPEATLQDAAQKMKALDVGALPVCKNDKLIGMLTDRDIAIRAIADGKDPLQCSVGDVMTGDVIYCFDDEDVEQAAKLMEERQIRRLVVMDHDKHAVGIVSLGDLATRQRDERLSGEALERISEPSGPQRGGGSSGSNFTRR
jgi:CBS domain-containing protein